MNLDNINNILDNIDMTVLLQKINSKEYQDYFVSPSGQEHYRLKLYWNSFIKGSEKAIDAVDNTIKDISKDILDDILPNFITRNRCPSDCNPSDNLLQTKNIQYPNITGLKEMDTDSTVNTWIYGDQPEATWDMRKTTSQKKYNKPRPWYGPISKKTATQYTCVWDNTLGNGRTSANPKKFTSYIPCNRFPGYKYVDK